MICGPFFKHVCRLIVLSCFHFWWLIFVFFAAAILPFFLLIGPFVREYAESVRQKTESLGLNVNIVQLSLTVSLTAAMENAAQRGLLYTVIITSQHEAHNSITLTILRGRNPQGCAPMPTFRHGVLVPAFL